MRPERARALSRRGTRTLVELADDYAHTYAPFIQAAVREVGHNYRQVAKWLTRERIPAQRAGQWKAQSVKNLVVRYRRLTGRRLLIPHKRFPTPAHARRRACAGFPRFPVPHYHPGASLLKRPCYHAGALKFMRHLLQCLEGTKSNDGPAVAALDAGQKGKGTGPSQ
jgi:hypothetical protein